MIALSVYESGLGFRALRIDAWTEEDIEGLKSVFRSDNAARGGELKGELVRLRVAITDTPPWRMTEGSGGVLLWTLTRSSADDVAGRIESAKDQPGMEIYLNNEDEDIVVELKYR